MTMHATPRDGFRRDVQAWFSLAASPPVARRAVGYAVVVGAVLIAINHSDAILRGDISPGRLARMGLTALVPYMVSTLSSVGAMRSATRAASPRHPTASPPPPSGASPCE